MRYRFIVIILLLAFETLSQSKNEETFNFDDSKLYSLNWYAKDLLSDSIPGISLNLAYNRILYNKKSQSITVAIIDSGIDIDHEDLWQNIWINEDEIPGNNLDDDLNGYIDDVNGWNFLGNEKGENISNETWELTRIYRKYSGLLESELDKKSMHERELFEEVKREYLDQLERARKERADLDNFILHYRFYQRYLQGYLKKKDLSIEEVRRINPYDITLSKAREFWIDVTQHGITEERINKLKETNFYKLNYHLNPEYDPRKEVIGDNVQDVFENSYGNNDVVGDRPDHGTHVAGIIGAVRGNGIGIDGIVDNVKIMALRVIPNGDERDKDVANAIRYAVDNGAKVINMSFSKNYSPLKKAVDDAVRYAEKNDVLIVHGSGNYSKNLDLNNVYPNAYYLDNSKARNWLTVGASTVRFDKRLTADFSNFGKNSVDLFAPGVDILSLVNNNGYDFQSGTSMASPMVAGVAALLFSYYPELGVREVKRIILQSCSELKGMVVSLPGRKSRKNVKFKNLSVTGGLVNAYNAAKMAEELTK